MKSVIILRHGQASSSSPNGDKGRELTTRGWQDSRDVGRFLTLTHCEPQAALVSTARRARETWEAAAESGGWQCSVQLSDALYMTLPESVLSMIQAVEDASCDRLLLVGHQPTWGDLVSQMLGAGSFNMPTNGMACVNFLADSWRDVSFGHGWLMWLISPAILVLPEEDATDLT